MYMIKIMEIRIKSLKKEAELINNELCLFETGGVNWKRVNRKYKIKMLTRFNKVDKRHSRMVFIHKTTVKLCKLMGLV